jgi:hypothetical protein
MYIIKAVITYKPQTSFCTPWQLVLHWSDGHRQEIETWFQTEQAARDRAAHDHKSCGKGALIIEVKGQA